MLQLYCSCQRNRRGKHKLLYELTGEYPVISRCLETLPFELGIRGTNRNHVSGVALVVSNQM
jgi:hypothetical protein